jgi:heme-degrading monooxygenase HmoA
MRLLDISYVVALGFGMLAGAPAWTAQADANGLLAMASKPGQQVIARVWHGTTPRAKADEYEQYLAAAIQKFPTIKGNLGYQLMRVEGGPAGDEFVEFQVISYWESLDAIKAYAGQDVRRTHDLPRDKDFLVNMEPLVRNYVLRVNAIRP